MIVVVTVLVSDNFLSKKKEKVSKYLVDTDPTTFSSICCILVILLVPHPALSFKCMWAGAHYHYAIITQQPNWLLSFYRNRKT